MDTAPLQTTITSLACRGFWVNWHHPLAQMHYIITELRIKRRTLCQMWFLYRRRLTPNHSTGPWRRYRTWERHTSRVIHGHCVSLYEALGLDLLFTLSVSFAARKRDFDHTRGERHEQWAAPAVDLHTDDAFVIHSINTAPEHITRIYTNTLTDTEVNKY